MTAISAAAPTRRKQRVPHPGWACCDPEQDLAGWVARERVTIARMRRWCRVWHARGRRLNSASIRALVTGDRAEAERLQGLCRLAHGNGNAYGQELMMREGHVDRVEAAHQFRLGAAATGSGGER
jgi:hypothetical protein